MPDCQSQNPTLHLLIMVPLSNYLTLCAFLHLQNKDKNSIFFIILLHEG